MSKVILISGGGGAIGSLTGQRLAARGYTVVLADMDKEALAQSPGHSAYASSKAGLEAFANCLRSEVAHQGVDVGVFFPGWIRTPMVTEKEERMPAFTRYQKSLPGPLRSLADPEDLAGVPAQAIDSRKSHLIYPPDGFAP